MLVKMACCQNKKINEISQFIITNKFFNFLIIFLIITTIIIYYFNNQKYFLTIFSIIIAILIFLLTHLFNRWEHYQNQKKLLRALFDEITTLIGKRETNGKSMGPHLQWVKDRKITDHGVYMIDAYFYCKNLDANIGGKETMPITLLLRMIVDKISLINFYSNKKREYCYNQWEKVHSKEKFDFYAWANKKFKDDKFINSLHNKLLEARDEVMPLLNELRCILNERFNINF